MPTKKRAAAPKKRVPAKKPAAATPAKKRATAKKRAPAKQQDLSAVASTRRDLARLPKDLAESGLAASALILARELDGDASSTSKSMCAKAYLEVMNRLRELAPPKREKDRIDELADQRARRRAQVATRRSAPTASPRT